MNWLAELVVCSGFFLIYLVEETVHQLVHPTAQRDHKSPSLTIERSSQPCETEPGSNASIGRREERTNSCCDATNHNDMEMQPRSEASAAEPSYNPKYSVRLSLSTSSVFPNYHAPDSLKPLPQEKPPPSNPSLSFCLATPRILRDFCTVLALSFHAVFEGLAIGLEESSEDVWKMLAAIASHKFVITFSLSLQLLEAGTTRLGFGLFLTTFSLISPLGVGVGLAVSEPADRTSEVHQVTVAVLQGLAAGAVLYVCTGSRSNRNTAGQRDVAGLLQLVGIIFLLIIIANHHLVHHNLNQHIFCCLGYISYLTPPKPIIRKLLVIPFKNI